ncbi:hypothetical protein NW762_006114 [Fusarium torreyae]|uniref:Xylanolytic transcriptional activator regulatory domain-containing protein n=1 Tax=Fusarium torreyae TaxID=1237075 RepID=A0A9W8S2A4_9HYPO|nr:hypothetical protein NW762_006114 [Fusarium torreyae]
MSRFHDSNNFSDQDALLIHGMLALAARHSSNACLAEIPAPDRADQFVKEATALYGKLRGAEEPPSIKYLQGCVLLAVNLAAAGPCHRTWILTGVCVRMAYDLDLCNMDDGGDTWEDAAEWVAMEERRRLFWIVWELDSFVSAITRRPSAINRQRVAVLLPSSDEAWFAQDPVKSSLLGTRPSEAWKSLVDSPNQDERAWFLIANYLMAVAYEMKTNQRTHQADRDELIDALTCFNIVITQRFSLENHVGLFDLNDFTKYNWIIGMHLMLTSARTCVSTFEDNPQASVLAYSREFCRIIHHWHPETVILSHPFLACILLTPQATLANTAVTELINTTSSNLEMTLLMLDQYGSVWKLASVLRDIVHLLKRRDSLSEQEVLLAKRFLIFFPALARRHKPASKVVSQANGEDRTHEGNGNSDELSFDQSLETLELSKQLDEQEAQLAVAHDFDTEELNVMTHFRLDVPDDWSSQIQFDNVCDDNQHFNYLQL